MKMPLLCQVRGARNKHNRILIEERVIVNKLHLFCAQKSLKKKFDESF